MLNPYPPKTCWEVKMPKKMSNYVVWQFLFFFKEMQHDKNECIFSSYEMNTMEFMVATKDLIGKEKKKNL
jgi:hypothetical protein